MLRKYIKINKNIGSSLCGVMLPMFFLIFISCSGRTAENMEPTGDTVEVEIEMQQPPSAEEMAMRAREVLGVGRQEAPGGSEKSEEAKPESDTGMIN